MLRTIAATGKVEIVRNGASMRCRKPVQAMPVSRISPKIRKPKGWERAS
jgi:hypothetical protein